MALFGERGTSTLSEQLILTREQLAAYQQEQLYQQEIFRNSQLAPPQKLVLLAVRNIIRATREGQIHLTDTMIHQIAQATSLKTTKVSSCLKELAEQGLIVRKNISEPPGKGKGEARIFIELREKSGSPHKSPQEGLHLSCPKCEDEMLDIRTTYSCPKCGYISQCKMS